MAFGKNQAMKQAIRLRIDRANDRSETARLISNRPVNPNRMEQARVSAPRRPGRSLRPFGPRPSAKLLRPNWSAIKSAKPRRPGRKVKFGPGSGRYGPGPR